MASHLDFMEEAINSAQKSPISNKAFSVGAVVALDGIILCTGYSRELNDSMHAEEMCIAKLAELNVDHSKLIMYTTMEPCGERLSGKKCCADLIIDARIPTVVVGALEPKVFIKFTKGIEKLKQKHIQIIMLPEFQGI